MEERARHRKFGKEEFDSAGFLEDDPFDLSDCLLDEIVDAIFCPDFEGSRSSYGCLILSDSIAKFSPSYLPGSAREAGTTEELIRECEGGHVFKFVGPNERGLVIFDRPAVSELDVFTLRDDALYKNPGLSHEDPPPRDLFLLKKYRNGDLSVFCREGIALHQSSRWRFLPYQYSYKSELLRRSPDLRRLNPQVLNSIFRILVHVLGPLKGAGTTMVLLDDNDMEFADGTTENNLANLKKAVLFSWGANITDRMHQRVLINLLTRTDGATFIRSDGTVIAMQVWLTPPQDEMHQQISDGGTRHLSGQVFSKGINGLVFVASSNGPISIFSRGKLILHTNQVKAGSQRN